MTAQMSQVILNRKVQAMYAQMSPEQRERENEFAARLRKSSQAIVEGPKEDRFGNVWVPSPGWEPAAVEEWKRRGGQYRKLDRMFNAWMFLKGTLSIDEARELYVKFFGQVIDRERLMLEAAERPIQCGGQR